MSGSARTDAHAQIPATVKVVARRQITCVFMHTYMIHFVDPKLVALLEHSCHLHTRELISLMHSFLFCTLFMPFMQSCI